MANVAGALGHLRPRMRDVRIPAENLLPNTGGLTSTDVLIAGALPGLVGEP